MFRISSVIPKIENSHSGYPNNPIYSILGEICQNNKPKKILEFGTGTGCSGIVILSNCDGILVTIDKEEHESKFDGFGFEDRLIKIIQDSTTFRTRSRFDLIHIDGGHDYETVKKDSEIALNIIKPNGIIVWDDGDSSDVNRYLMELKKKEPKLRFDRGVGILEL